MFMDYGDQGVYVFISGIRADLDTHVTAELIARLNQEHERLGNDPHGKFLADPAKRNGLRFAPTPGHAFEFTGSGLGHLIYLRLVNTIGSVLGPQEVGGGFIVSDDSIYIVEADALGRTSCHPNKLSEFMASQD